MGDGHIFPSQGFVPCGLSGPVWLQRISGTQLWPTQFLAHCSLRRLRPKPSVLHTAPSSCWVGPHDPFIMQPSTLPGQMGLVAMNLAFNLASFLAGQLCTRVQVPCLGMSPLPSLKSPYMAPTVPEPLSSSPCTPLAQKVKNLFLGEGWPQLTHASSSFRS